MNKKLFVTTKLFLLLFASVYSKTALPQSLFSSIQKINKLSEDTAKLNLLINIADQYSSLNSDSAIFFYKEAEKISKPLLNNKKTRTVAAEYQALALLGIGSMYDDLNNFKLSRIYITKALHLAERHSLTELIAKCTQNLGVIYHQNSDYETAKKYYNKAIEQYKNAGIEKPLGGLFNNIGTLHLYKGDYKSALENYHKALAINEKYKNKKVIGQCLNNIGLVHDAQNDFKMALVYFNKALEIVQEMGDKKGLPSSYLNMGTAHHSLKEYDTAFLYYRKALEVSKELEMIFDVARCYNNMGIVCKDKNDYKKALEYYQKSYRIIDSIGFKSGAVMLLDNIGILYTNLKDCNKAVEYTEKALSVAKEINELPRQKEIYSNLSAAYECKGDLKKALECQKMYAVLHDSIMKIEKNKQIAELEKKYQTEKKQQQIELQKAQISEQGAVIKQQFTQKIAFVAGFVLMSLLAVIVFMSYRRKKRDNDLLYKQKKEIEFKNVELAKLSVVASETNNAITIMDASGKIYGYDLIELHETKGRDIFNVSTNKDIRELFNVCIKTKLPITFETSCQNKFRKTVWFQTNLSPVVNEKGEVIKMITIDTDITAIKEAEQEILEKNEELHQQNEEITTQRDEIEAQRNLVLKQKEHIEEIYADLTDSIHYAERIQQAVLPSDKMLETCFSVFISKGIPETEIDSTNFFILYKPRDIVSGDFYWIHQRNEFLLIAIADCTGHGVPGAFMSMLGISFLNEIAARTDIQTPARALDELRLAVISSLKQNNPDDKYKIMSLSSLKDGMDIAFAAINTKTLELQFAGANNPLWIVKTLHATSPPALQVVSPDKQPIGIHEIMKPFTNYTLQLQKGDVIYMMSDGYESQFGGSAIRGGGKKFLSKNLKKILEEISAKPMPEQKNILDNTIENWKNNYENKYEQTDDITIFGLKI